MKSLIVCADDFGMNPAVDEGIAELVALGRISATSCLVHSPAWPDAAKRLPDRARCAIGLHLDFTQYAKPHWTVGRLILLSVLRRLDARALRASIDRQLDQFESAVGTPPDYIDGHQHVHQLPQIRDALIDALCARYPAHGATRRPWLRISAIRPLDGGKSRLVTMLGSRVLRSAAQVHGFATTDTLIGMYDFTGDSAAYLARLGPWLDASRGATALMCHPARRVEPGEIIANARYAEYCALRGAAFAGLLSERGVTLAMAPGAVPARI